MSKRTSEFQFVKCTAQTTFSYYACKYIGCHLRSAVQCINSACFKSRIVCVYVPNGSWASCQPITRQITLYFFNLFYQNNMSHPYNTQYPKMASNTKFSEVWFGFNSTQWNILLNTNSLVKCRLLEPFALQSRITWLYPEFSCLQVYFSCYFQLIITSCFVL